MRMRSALIVLFLTVAGSVIVACGQEPATFNFNDITTQPFRLNTLETTPYGPAWADILVRPENFLLCQGAAIALCFYSGPGPVTPCYNDGAHPGRSNCTCYEIPAGSPYLVDINAILNRDVYLDTVKTCGHGGENCLPRGKMPAPVCDAINNNKLIPGADLISTFSFALESSMPTNQQTSCTSATPYAGCMTAPCKKTGAIDPTTGLPLVQCACPNYAGPFEVPQDLSQTGNHCSFGNINTWSAAYAPLGGGILHRLPRRAIPMLQEQTDVRCCRRTRPSFRRRPPTSVAKRYVASTPRLIRLESKSALLAIRLSAPSPTTSTSCCKPAQAFRKIRLEKFCGWKPRSALAAPPARSAAARRQKRRMAKSTT